MFSFYLEYILNKKTYNILRGGNFNDIIYDTPINNSTNDINISNDILSNNSENNNNISFNSLSDNDSINSLDILWYDYQRKKAFDDISKKKKTGIYRVKYLDNNDLDKKDNPKIKFRYYYANNDQPISQSDLERINKLGLAPAYEDVWVSSDPTSKIQATGIDAKGRKQYRYHPNHIKDAGVDKFLRLYKFIKAMPKLDKQMEEDEKLPLFKKERTISLMLKIVKELNIRVGKEVYAQKNKSYGITSMKKSHLKIDPEKKIAKFNFKAKSNKQVQYTLTDKDIIDELMLLDQLEGEKLFQYKNDNGNILRVNDVDLNQYIQLHAGKEFSAKDFRTYAANFYFIKALLRETKKHNPTTQKQIKKNLSTAQENTAFYLRHTKSISKKSYTMELIREMYMTDPKFFIDNKNKQTLTVLLEVLKIFRDKIKNKPEDKE
jgi:DNA topoisomerase-1